MTNSIEPLIHPLGVWSSLETFTSHVCGLPTGAGCWRHRTMADGSGVEETGDRVAWCTWWLRLLPNPIRAEYFAVKPTPHHGAYALFGMSDDANSALGAAPQFIELRGEGGAHSDDIQEWFHEGAGPRPTLFRAFGGDTFQHLRIDELDGDFSLADLINLYLDRHCPYRAPSKVQDQHERAAARGFGIAKCHLEVSAAQHLTSARVVFVQVDPRSFELREIVSASLGGIPRCDVSRAWRLLRPTQILRHDSGVSPSDALSPAGREQILPTEVDRGWLDFTAGEMSSYLLYWLLVRVLRDDTNRQFAGAFKKWSRSEASSPASQRAFEALLDATVTLRSTEALHTRLAPQTPMDELWTLRNWSGSFRSVLPVLDLDPQLPRNAISHVRKFLSEFDRYRALPMYASLPWQSGASSEGVDDSWRTLESVFRSFRLETPGSRHPTPDDLIRRSVFPVPETLISWPRGQGVMAQVILPLWEDEVGPVDGVYRTMPVLLAQLFVSDRTTSIGQWLQLLGPYASSVARAHYRAAAAAEALNQSVLHLLTHEVSHALGGDAAGLRARVAKESPADLADEILATLDLAHGYSRFANLLISSLGSDQSMAKAGSRLRQDICGLRDSNRLTDLLEFVAQDTHHRRTAVARARNAPYPPLEGCQPLPRKWRTRFDSREMSVGYLLITELMRNAVKYGDASHPIKCKTSSTAASLTFQLTHGYRGETIGEELPDALDGLHRLLVALFPSSGIDPPVLRRGRVSWTLKITHRRQTEPRGWS
jgi:hypothetical protein